MGDYIGEFYRAYKGDTWSLDCLECPYRDSYDTGY